MLLTQGCVRDDLSVCGVRLMFNYMPRSSVENKFATDIRQVNIYAFDANTGVFVNQFEATTENMVDGCVLYINIEPGDYDFIVWGNTLNDYDITPFERGKTTIDEAKLTLKVQADRVKQVYPDSLYYGSVLDAKVLAADLQANQIINVDMQKNNKIIHVIAHGLYDDNSILEEDSVSPSFNCYIDSKNGNYRFNNYPTGEHYTYIPKERVLKTEKVLSSDFNILREFNNPAQTDSRIRVVHRNKTKQGTVEEEEFFNISLTACLLIVAAAGDISLTEEFTIEIFVTHTNGTVSIKIGDWQSGGDGTGVILY
jgi:hypothetical protein